MLSTDEAGSKWTLIHKVYQIIAIENKTEECSELTDYSSVENFGGKKFFFSKKVVVKIFCG